MTARTHASRTKSFFSMIPLAAAALAVAVSLPTPALAKGAEAASPYRTEIERRVQGTLTDENLRQASLLGSHVLEHAFEASAALADERVGPARQHLDKAMTLVGVIRELLPTTHVTTTVVDQRGRRVYEHAKQVQDDRIPLYEDMTAVEVLELVTDAKEEEAAIQGVRLADVELVFSRALLDLSYLERKIDAASRALAASPPDHAMAATSLLLAVSNGVELVVSKADDPLVEATHALTMAERQAERGHETAAKENLRLARTNLEAYRAVAEPEASADIRELEREIRRVSEEISGPGVTDRIRSLWHEVTGLLEKETGEAVATDGSEAEASEDASRMPSG